MTSIIMTPENKLLLKQLLARKEPFTSMNDVFDLKQKFWFDENWRMRKLDEKEMREMKLLDDIVGNNLLSERDILDFLNELIKQ